MIKNISLRFLLALGALIFMGNSAYSQTGVAINATGVPADGNAILDVSSTTKGVLLPRVTSAQRTAMAPSSSSDFGMLVYDTDTDSFWYWDGATWQEVPNAASINHNSLDEAYDEGGSGAGRIITADAGNVEIQGPGFLTVASNVGIGTTSPDRRMKVSGSGWTALEIENTDNQDAALELTSQGVSNYVYTDNTGFLAIESAPTKEISLRTNGPNERMVIQSNGQVRVNNLADPNSAVVLSNTAGVLGKTSLTGSANDVLLGTGAFGPASAFEDDDWYKVLGTATPTAIGDWIYTNGNVGINFGASANPYAALHVQSNAYVGDNNGLGMYNSNATLHLARADNPHLVMEDMGNNTGGLAFNAGGLSVTTENGDIDFRTGVTFNGDFSSTGSERMIVKNTGNVGIGTTTPDAKLNVGDANGATIYLTREDATTAANDVLGSLLFDSTDDTGPSTNDASAGIRAYASVDHGNSNKGAHLGFFTKNNVPSTTAATERMRIKSDGNVGIGLTNPASIFQISTTQIGNVSKLHNPTLSNNSLVGHEFGKANSTNNMVEFRYNHVSDGSSANWVNLGLWGNANTLNVLGTGNVGIGTTGPAQKLEVAGTARLTNLGGAGDKLVYTNNSGDLLRSTSAIDANSLVDGSGAANYLARWTDSNTLGTGTTYDNGTNVGIGSTGPNQKLLIGTNGGIGFGGTGLNSADKKLYSPADGDLEWMTNSGAGVHGFAISHQGTKAVYLNIAGNSYLNGGNVGIGTTGPVYKLQVAGTAEASTYYVNHGSGNVLEVGDDAWIGDVNSANLVGIYGQSNSAHGGLRLGNNGSAYLYSNGTANIGIGNTAPIQTLDVTGRIHVNSGVIQRGGAAITGTSDLGLYSRVSGNFIRIVTNGGLVNFYSDDNIGSSVNVSIAANGSLEAQKGMRSERHIRFYKRSRGNGSGGTDNLGNYDFCYLAGVAFRNSDSYQDEDDDYQCNVFSTDINGSAEQNEGESEDFSANFSYATRPYWKLYSECYEDCSNSTCTAMCINFDY